MDHRRPHRRARIPYPTAAGFVFAIALVLAVGRPGTVRADDAAPLIGVPFGLGVEGAISVTSGPTPATEYLTLGEVTVLNPNRENAQSYALADWALTDGDQVFHPTPRPGLGAIDLSAPGIVFPLERFRHTITFVVPRTTRRASLQFTPQWYDDTGARVQFCCA